MVVGGKGIIIGTKQFNKSLPEFKWTIYNNIFKYFYPLMTLACSFTAAAAAGGLTSILNIPKVGEFVFGTEKLNAKKLDHNNRNIQ